MKVMYVIVPSCFIAFDILSGLVAAIKNGTYKSSVMREGLYHKIGELLAIAFGYLCEYSFPIIGVTVNIPICQSIMIYIVIMEVGSVIENIAKISPEVKAVLSKVLRRDEATEVGRHEKH